MQQTKNKVAAIFVLAMGLVLYLNAAASTSVRSDSSFAVASLQMTGAQVGGLPPTLPQMTAQVGGLPPTLPPNG